MHSAACCGEIEEGPFTCAVVGLETGRVSHIHSWAASELHANLADSACIGNAEKNLTGLTACFLPSACVVFPKSYKFLL